MTSLDVYLSFPGIATRLERDAIYMRRNGATVEVSREEWDDLNPGIEPVTVTIGGDVQSDPVYSANITHNLGKMAAEAGIYEALWRPDEIGIKTAYDLIGYLSQGLALLKSDPARFEKFNSPNGWGMYEHFVPFVDSYLKACAKWPAAVVSVWR